MPELNIRLWESISMLCECALKFIQHFLLPAPNQSSICNYNKTRKTALKKKRCVKMDLLKFTSADKSFYWYSIEEHMFNIYSIYIITRRIHRWRSSAKSLEDLISCRGLRTNLFEMILVKSQICKVNRLMTQPNLWSQQIVRRIWGLQLDLQQWILRVIIITSFA